MLNGPNSGESSNRRNQQHGSRALVLFDLPFVVTKPKIGFFSEQIIKWVDNTIGAPISQCKLPMYRIYGGHEVKSFFSRIDAKIVAT